MGEVLGAALYGAVGEPLLDQLASKVGLGISDDIVKGFAGYFVAKNTSGVVKSMGMAALSIAAYKVGKSGLTGLFGGASTAGATTSGATFA